MLPVGRVDAPGVVGLEPVGRAALVALVGDVQRDVDLLRAAVPERGGADAVPVAGHERAVPEPRPVRGDRDAVGAHRDGGGRAVLGALEQHAALGERHVLRRHDGLGARVVVQPAPRLTGLEVDDDDPVRALVGRVRDEGRAAAAPAEVEAHVVQVGGRQRHVVGERDHLLDRVGREVDAHELRAAGLRRLEQRAAGVEHPEPVRRIHDDALHGHERPRVVVALRRVPRLVRVGHHLAVAQLADREGRTRRPTSGSSRRCGHAPRRSPPSASGPR